MSKHLLILGFCSLLAAGYGVANFAPEQRSAQPAVQARDAQIVQSSTAATTLAQPRQTNQAGDAATEAIRAHDSWIKWPSLTDF